MLGPDPTCFQIRIRIRSLVSKRVHFSAVVWTIYGEEWYHTNRFHTNQNAAYQLHELHDESNVEYISGIKPHFEILIISYSENVVRSGIIPTGSIPGFLSHNYNVATE